METHEVEQLVLDIAIGEKSLAQLGREYGVTHQTVVYHRDRNSDTIEGIRNELKAQGKYRGN